MKKKAEKVDIRGDGKNIKEWIGIDFSRSTRAAENRTRWKGIVTKCSAVPLLLIQIFISV